VFSNSIAEGESLGASCSFLDWPLLQFPAVKNTLKVELNLA
jgi:hypothetical protein